MTTIPVTENKVYLNDFGTIIMLDCKVDVSTATWAGILVKKPNGKEIKWQGSVYDFNYVKYVVREGDLDVIGEYKIQAYIESPNWTGRGETASFTVYNKFE